VTEITWEALRSLLVDRYSEFRSRLSRRLGSADLASDTLQETWLQLQRPGTPAITGRADAYVYRVALNVARDRARADHRRLAYSEVEMLRHLDWAEIDPEEIVALRSEMAALAKAINELTPRRRAIFLSARLNGIPHREIAKQLGISKRMVERELKAALDHCAGSVGIILRGRYGSSPEELSL
jgi:RNA polymerase sigma-70 factor (ECF subfamily)